MPVTDFGGKFVSTKAPGFQDVKGRVVIDLMNEDDSDRLVTVKLTDGRLVNLPVWSLTAIERKAAKA
jgi:hypothetical protein